MAKVTLGFAAALMVLGVAAYVLTGMRSWTALIPFIAGGLLLVCGLIGQNTARRKHAMHAAAAMAVIGFGGSVPGAINLVRLANQGEQTLTTEQKTAADVKDDEIVLKGGRKMRPVADQVKAGMAGLLLPYIAISVKSFIDARVRRKMRGDGR